MKAKSLILLTMLVALGSCGREGVETAGGDQAPTMGFTAYETKSQAKDVPTRGTTIDVAEDLRGDGFGVWTYSDDELYVGGNVVWNDGENGWDYGESKYWPATTTVTSYAIAPAGASGYSVETREGASPLVSYTLPEFGDDQKDLMFAGVQTYAPGDIPVGGTIPEVFHHALSRISFKAFKKEFDDPTESVVISSITLRGFAGSGEAPLEFPVAWEVAGSEEHTFDIASGELANEAVDALGATTLDAGVGEIFMMPQALDGVVIDVEYSIGGAAQEPKEGLPLAGTWEPGRSYAITFAVSDTGEIEINPPGTEWLFPASQEDFVVEDTGYYQIEAWGGNGGNGGSSGAGAAGGVGQRLSGIFEFSAGDVLHIQVGGAGANAGNATGGANGGGGSLFGDGGGGGDGRGNGRGGGGGGAASGVLLNGSELSNIIIASAGGGGGGGGRQNTSGGAGGAPQAAGAAGNAAGGAAGTIGQSPNPTGTNATNNNSGGGGGGGGGYMTYSGGGGRVANSNNSTAGGGGGGANYVGASGAEENPGHIALPENTRPGTGGYVVITYLGK